MYYDACTEDYYFLETSYTDGMYQSTESETTPDCNMVYQSYDGVDGDVCLEYYSDVCNGHELYDDHSVYTNTYTEGADEETYVYFDSYENCDGTVYDIYSIYTDGEGTFDYYHDDSGSETTYEAYFDGYYTNACDLVEDVCITYYADYYESGVLDNGYAWEYYLDPHGIPSFGWEYNPLGFDEDSEYGVYINYYEFILPDYWKLAREDTVGCYSDVCVSYDGVYEDCTSTFNDYYNEIEEENSYYQVYTDCGEDAYYNEFSYSYVEGEDDSTSSYVYYTSSGPDDFVDYTHLVTDDACYEETYMWEGDSAAYSYTNIYHDYLELVDYTQDDGWYCTGSIYKDCDPEIGTTSVYCVTDGAWSEYYANYVPDGEGDDEFDYYMNYDDGYYHVYCSDELSQDCETQYDDYYDAGTVYYVDGEVYYWEIYAMPGEEEYSGKHVHAALDGSSYSVYTFSEPDGSAFTYYETPQFASTYDYATGAYTEWLQDFYGEAEAENLDWYATAYVSDDSDSIDDFSASMGTENVKLTAVYDELDDLIVTVTTEKDAFYAQWTVGNEDDAVIEYGDDFESGSSYNDFTQTSELWYTYYDIDGNKFEVHNYAGQGDVNGNLYISEIDGQVVEFYYQWDDALHNDQTDVDSIGVEDFTAYSVSVDYTN